MKKTSIFVIFVSFILSIFLISFYGLAIVDDHMKAYISSVEILSYDVSIYEKTNQKIKNVSLDEETGIAQIYIDYSVKSNNHEDASLYDYCEFTILSGNGEFELDNITYPYAEINKSRLTFYHQTAIKVMLSTTDGSNKTDFCLFVCK